MNPDKQEIAHHPIKEPPILSTHFHLPRVLMILFLVIVVALIFGAISYLWGSQQQMVEEQHTRTVKVTKPQSAQPQNTSTSSNSCKDFGAFSKYISDTINPSYTQSVMQPNPYVITSFEWKRKTEEPYITYPVIEGFKDDYQNANNSSFIKQNYSLINSTINKEATSLNWVPDTLNTLPLQNVSPYDSLVATFGFKKNGDLYTIVLSYIDGKQAPPESTLQFTCGRAINTFDKVYDTLNYKEVQSLYYPGYFDFVQIAVVSPDNTVYGITGSPNQIKDPADYYYIKGKSAQLVSTDSYPAQCSTLDAKKVGKGMRCASGSVQY
jgi:hypothetical protein